MGTDKKKIRKWRLPFGFEVLIVCTLLAASVYVAAARQNAGGAQAGSATQSGAYLSSAYERYCNMLECSLGAEGTESAGSLGRDPFDFESADGRYRVKIGARLMIDGGGIDKDSDLRAAFGEPIDVDNIIVRRGRLYATGGILGTLDFRIGIDFSSETADASDAWIGIPAIPYVGSINIGYMKEPLSLEEITSSSFITFMERSLSDYFTAGRQVGVMTHNTELGERLSWAVGVFKAENDFSNFGESDIVGRVTALPWYTEGGEKLLHFGLGYSHRFRDPDETPIDIGTRPETHLTTDFLVDTGDIPAHGADLVVPEMALVLGPLSLQSEYYLMHIDAKSRANADLWGWYAYVSYFLTGEHRSYYRPSGIFDLTAPKRPFSLSKGGWGAWEVGFRYSHIDLNDSSAGVMGGGETNYTFGINWYLNRYMRVMFNYTRADASDRPSLPDGSANIFQSRLQFEF